MCGINGFNFKDEKLIEEMNRLTRHRGPDGTGVFIAPEFSLGHNLLAIIEKPENSKQPYVSEDGNFVLVYNGEIYNYRDLRRELEQSGLQFKTDGDTEVLLRGLISKGEDFIKKLDGMFAFCFADKRKGTFLLARDRFGMKPLYYFRKNNKFIFSSEIRGILASVDSKLNQETVNIYFSLGYVPGSETLFKDINKVNPGEYLKFFIETGELDKKWFISNTRFESGETNPEGIRKMIGESVNRHTMGLRPFGIYLSGGLDSTVILHELAEGKGDLVNTYTTRFDTKDSGMNQDADFAKRLCGDYKINYHELFITEKDFMEAIPASITSMEEPRYNFSVPAYWLLAKYASKDITVVLSGSGGDEVFLGYEKYLESLKLRAKTEQNPLAASILQTLKLSKRGKLSLGRFLNLKDELIKWAFLNAIAPKLSRELSANRFDLVDVVNYLKKIERPEYANPLPNKENGLAELDRLFWLADEDFIRTDKIAMNFGMEGRFPFVAKNIVELMNGVSPEEKLKNGETKALIRNSYRSYLPDYIIDKPKTGWYAPAVEWMHSSLGKMVREVLTDDFYEPTASLFDLDSLRVNYFEKVPKFTRANIKKFMPVFAFQIWAKNFRVTL